MFNYKKQITALTFSTLIATGFSLSTVPAQAQTTAQKLCRQRSACTVVVNSRKGAIVREGPGSNYSKVAIIPYGYDVLVRVSKSSRNWVKLNNGSGWINTQGLVLAGD